MTDQMVRERPDTHDMFVVHRVFRRETALLPRLVRNVRPGDTARAAVVADHYRGYALGLHHHHTGEDELIWPLLLARVDLEAELVLRMEEQHERVAAGLDAVSALLPEWERTADRRIRRGHRGRPGGAPRRAARAPRRRGEPPAAADRGAPDGGRVRPAQRAVRRGDAEGQVAVLPRARCWRRPPRRRPRTSCGTCPPRPGWSGGSSAGGSTPARPAGCADRSARPGPAEPSAPRRQAGRPPGGETAGQVGRPGQAESCSEAAASELVYPSWQVTMTSRSYRSAKLSRASLRGSSRHSSTLRSMIIAPGISPCSARWAAGRMSTRSAPRSTATKVSSGSSRRSRARAAASRSSMPVEPGGGATNAGAVRSSARSPLHPGLLDGHHVQAAGADPVAGHGGERRAVDVDADRRAGGAVGDAVDVPAAEPAARALAELPRRDPGRTAGRR